MSLGETSEFLICNDQLCKRCFYKKKGRAKAFDQGGSGKVPKVKGKKWREYSCESCQLFNLESGDCLLFYGDGRNHVCHGSTQTFANSAPNDMPDWCKGYRVSVQYRFSPKYHS